MFRWGNFAIQSIHVIYFGIQSKPQSASGSFEGVSGSVPTAARDVCDHAVTSNCYIAVPRGFTFHHAHVVYDASGRIYMVSNAVPLRSK
jgi:hypothetical protein